MNAKESRQNLSYTVIPACIIGIIVLLIFSWFIRTNHERIVDQNVNYVSEVTRQCALRIENTLEQAQQNLENIALLYGDSLSSPDVDVEKLESLIGNTQFAYIRFADKNGISHTAQGTTADVSDRTYFTDGMAGNTGMDILFNSRFTHETLMVFYTPLRCHGEIIGVIAGMYQIEQLQEIISATYFGEVAATYLCLQDGTVIASSRPEGNVTNLLDAFRASKETTAAVMSHFEKVFAELGTDTFVYEAAHGTGTGYLTRLSNTDWMLFQAFPSSVTAEMLQESNRTGIQLEISLILLFASYIILLLFWNRRRQKKLLTEKNIEIQYMEWLFGTLTENTNDIFALFSADSYHTDYISPNVERVLGISTDEIQKDIRALTSAAVKDEGYLSADHLASIPHGEVWQGDREMRRRDTGEPYWAQESLYHVTLGNADKYVLRLSDRTKEWEMNQRLRQALDGAQSANRAKSHFLNNISHDIRTPMNAIVGFSVLLAKDADQPEKVRNYARKITSSSQYMLGLINDVLDMSKIESGKTSLNIEEFRLPELLEDLGSIMRSQAREKHQDFDLKVQGNVPELLLGDRVRINQILLNLLSNAHKYTPEGGAFSLTVRALPQTSSRYASLRFVVEDNGIGMHEEFLQTIFDPFSREISSTTNQVQGTGLGMAITKNLTNLMGGDITVHSTPDKGTTFTVELELALPEQVRDEQFWQHHGISQVLVVDDEEDICLEIQALMEGTGVTVDYATEGIKAVEMAMQKADAYHVALLDWKMPGMDGVETARRLRACLGPDVPILVLTAYDWSEIEDEARAAGIDTFLAKPFFISSFQRALEGVKNKPKKPESTADNEALLTGMHFLAAEDNSLNAELLEELLDMEGATCEIAANGQEALERFRSSAPNQFSAILMDIQMPVMNGYEATRAIRACNHPRAASIPIIAMTANAFVEDIRAAAESGMNSHIAKPLDIEKLKATLLALKKNDAGTT